ncbi:hypothetical protein C0993_007467, partial [Termitomyces sp. T159_Od127]
MTYTDLSPLPRFRRQAFKAGPGAYDLGPAAFLQQPALLFEHPSPAGCTQALE